jgi:hypothetical protein
MVFLSMYNEFSVLRCSKLGVKGRFPNLSGVVSVKFGAFISFKSPSRLGGLVFHTLSRFF